MIDFNSEKYKMAVSQALEQSCKEQEELMKKAKKYRKRLVVPYNKSMSNCCDKCHRNNCCGDCCSAPCPKPCKIDLQADPYDPQTWWLNGDKIRIPKIAETCTSLSTDFSNATLNYKGECGNFSITGRQLGQLIKLDDLRDVEAPTPDSCSMLMWNPHCDFCADGCTKVEAAWEAYHIPDAGDCVMEPDENGYYHVLKKTDCGCPVECKLPVIPDGMTSLNYVRDSVPDDPDFPWYYGNYNDTINLYLAENAPQYFGKYDLKVTVNYGIQAIKSAKFNFNYNFRSLVCPVIEGESVKVTKVASILQGFAMYSHQDDADIPWGSTSLRGSFVFIVPKGKEAYLHHEYRVRTNASFPNYYTGQWDGKKVPDEEAALNAVLHPASRLNALQVIIEPTQGSTDYDPVADAERSQLDAPVDEYPPLGA